VELCHCGEEEGGEDWKRWVTKDVKIKVEVRFTVGKGGGNAFLKGTRWDNVLYFAARSRPPAEVES
jgi:hypothetical protein